MIVVATVRANGREPTTLRCAAQSRATENDDVIHGSSLGDAITGQAGNDTLIGNGGNDVIDGGAGNDVLRGFKGRDGIVSLSLAHPLKYQNLANGNEQVAANGALWVQAA